MKLKSTLCKTFIASICLLSSGTMAAQAQTGSNDKMPVLRITIDGNISGTMPYTNGTMELTDENGNVMADKAQFRTRGATAKQYSMKPSLNMKIRTDDYSASKDVDLLGLREASKWILDAMAIDRICMRNRVAMDVWNEYSKLPYDSDDEGSTTNFNSRSGTVGRFVEVYINNEYKGIYCLSDRINRKLLNLKKYDEKKQKVRGVLYKSGTLDIEDQDNRNFTADWKVGNISYRNAWELKEPEDFECKEAWEPLIDLFDNRKTYEEVRKYFFLDNLVDYQLHIMAFSIQDNWGNKNHYFSIRNIQKDIDDADPDEAARRKCIVSPWDLDTSLGGDATGKYYNGNYSKWTPADVVKNGGCYPFNICQGQEEYKNLLKARWEEVRKGAFSKENINKRLEAYRDLFINSGAWERMVKYWDTQKYKPQYVTDLTKEISQVEEWYANQYQLMDNYFGIKDTGISSTTVGTKKSNGAIYSVEGIRLDKAPEKGLYIQDGKLKMK